MKNNLLFSQVTAIGKRLAMVLTVLFTLGVGSVWAEGTETFEQLANATSYSSRSWTGVNGQTWSATLARTDQKISGNRGLTFSNANSSKTITMKLTDAQKAAGIGTFTFKYKHPYSDSGKTNTFSISVNGSNYSSGTLSYTSSTATKTITINAVPNSTSITITITGTARLCVDDFSWTSYVSAASHTVTYNANGGSGTMNSSTGSSVTIAECSFIAPSGKVFSEWNDNSNGTGTSYDPGDVVTEDLKLYAIWEAIPTHKVHFNTGGLVDIESVDVQEGQTYNITQTPAASLTQECEYNTFVGWTESNRIANPSSKPTIVNSIKVGSSDITLYAVYSKTEGGGGSAAEQGTTMFSENWKGCTNNTQPAQPTTSGSAVYNDADIDYVWYTPSGGSKTQTYTSGGPNSNENILISKNNGYWKVVGIPTGQAETLTLSFSKSGSGVLSVSTSTSNVSISGSTITIGSSSVNTFDLIFTNTKTGDNLRLDDISVVVAEAGATGGTTYSLTPECTTETSVCLIPKYGGDSGGTWRVVIEWYPKWQTACGGKPKKDFSSYQYVKDLLVFQQILFVHARARECI